MQTTVSYANRGTSLEEVTMLANLAYRNHKVAVIHKVPTEWLPIRNSKGKICSAKVERKAAVDFLGHIFLPSGPLPLAFDAKEVSKGNRWPLSNLAKHQYEYLRDSALTGAFAFLLIGFWQLQRFYVLPFSELQLRWEEWKSKTGPASVKAGDAGLIRVEFLDYLDFLQREGDANCPYQNV